MTIAPSEARQLTLAEYQGIMFQHNLRMDPEGQQEPVEAPSDDDYDLMEEMVEAMGLGGAMH